jgi:hypothetical protein
MNRLEIACREAVDLIARSLLFAARKHLKPVRPINF